MHIKLAQSNDLQWVNSRYKEINFVQSDLKKEQIAIAEINGEKTGIGRLVQIDINNAELGGMYVIEKYRNQGIARKIVEFLLRQGKKYQSIYCLPFEHLKNFYHGFGFVEQEPGLSPKEIQTKYLWCNKTYPHKVLLLKLSCPDLTTPFL